MSFPSSPAELDDSRRAASKPPADPHKACKVCGDRANGYNFGVLTCESCKAFFRRNAAKDQEIKCPFSGSCGITAASRRYCQACRLKKCFEVGMNNDWLLESKPPSKPGRKKVKREREEEESAGNEGNDEPHSSEEDNVKVSKAYLNELMRKAKRPPARCECECRCGFYPPSTRLTAASEIKDAATPSTASVASPFVPPLNPHSPSTSCANVPSTSCYEMPTTTIIGLPSHIQMPYRVPPIPQSVISMLQPMSQAGHPSILQYPPHMVQQPAHQISFGSTEDVKLSVSEYSRFIEEKAMLMELSRQQQQQQQGHSSMGGVMGGMMGGSEMVHRQQISYDKYARLGMEERNLLQELVQAAEPLNKPLDMHFLDGSQLSVMDIVKITETALRRMVCMTRDLEAFKQLPPDDKMELVKGCCSELLILRGVMAFDSRKNAWAHAFAQGTSGMEVKLEVLKSTAGSQNYYDEHKKFLESFDDRVRCTESVILVLMAILIFTPDRPKLSLREKIAGTRNRYSALLSRVLECEFGLSECGAMYERLMSNLRDIRHINHGLVRIYYGFDPAQLDPLIKELFDLQS